MPNRFDLVKAAASTAPDAAPLLLEIETQYELSTKYAMYIGKLLTKDSTNQLDPESVMKRIGAELADLAFQASGTVIPADSREPLLELLGLDSDADDETIRKTGLSRNNYVETLESARNQSITIAQVIEQRAEEARSLMGRTGLEEL